MAERKLTFGRIALVAGLAVFILAGCVAGGSLGSPAVTSGPGSPSPTISPSGQPNRSPAPAESERVLGRIIGHLSAGPTCPVETVPPNPACAPKPVAGATVIATDPAGVEVSRAVSKADGSYELALAPGTYRLAPQPIAGQAMRAPAATSVTVGLGTDALVVDFSYDTGIR